MENGQIAAQEISSICEVGDKRLKQANFLSRIVVGASIHLLVTVTPTEQISYRTVSVKYTSKVISYAVIVQFLIQPGYIARSYAKMYCFA